jgi:hypothetical protein
MSSTRADRGYLERVLDDAGRDLWTFVRDRPLGYRRFGRGGRSIEGHVSEPAAQASMHWWSIMSAQRDHFIEVHVTEVLETADVRWRWR